MSRRKDQERVRRLKQQNPDYVGFRGVRTEATPPPALESVECSVCGRRRNVPTESLPSDRSTYMCLRCREEPAATSHNAPL